MEERDRPVFKIHLREALEETLLNLEGLENDLATVKRRLSKHLEAARAVDL